MSLQDDQSPPTDNSPPPAARRALEAATAAGIAPIDVARIARVELPARYQDRVARTSDYRVRWFTDGETIGFDPISGLRISGSAGWYVCRADGKPVPRGVRDALSRLVQAASAALADLDSAQVAGSEAIGSYPSTKEAS